MRQPCSTWPALWHTTGLRGCQQPRQHLSPPLLLRRKASRLLGHTTRPLQCCMTCGSHCAVSCSYGTSIGIIVSAWCCQHAMLTSQCDSLIRQPSGPTQLPALTVNNLPAPAATSTECFGRRDPPVPGKPLQAAHAGAPVARQRLSTSQGSQGLQVQGWGGPGQRQGSGQACWQGCARQAEPQPSPALPASPGSRPCASAAGKPVPPAGQCRGPVKPGVAPPGTARAGGPCPSSLSASGCWPVMEAGCRAAGRAAGASAISFAACHAA